MIKKQFSIYLYFLTLAIAICLDASAMGIGIMGGSTVYSEVIHLPKYHRTAKYAIDVEMAARPQCYLSDANYGEPDEYFTRLQRLVQPVLTPPNSNYSHILDGILAEPSGDTHPPYLQRDIVFSLPYYYVFLFRLTPF